jgi:hypothetical protein
MVTGIYATAEEQRESIPLRADFPITSNLSKIEIEIQI